MEEWSGLGNVALLMKTFCDFTWSVLKLKNCEAFMEMEAEQAWKYISDRDAAFNKYLRSLDQTKLQHVIANP